MPDKGQLTTGEVQFWLSEANSCVARQDLELIKRNNYPFLINYYEGIEKIDAKHPHVSTETQYAIISEYFPSTNSLISEIMYQNPDILLDALKPQAEDGTPLMKSALQYGFDKSEALIENRLALFDMLYAGYCAVEVDQLPEDDDGLDAESVQEDYQEPKEKSIFDKVNDKFKSIIGNEKEAEQNLAAMSPKIESNFATVQGTYVRRYSPLDVPLDWRAERLRDRRYNIKKVWMSKAEFDVKYPDFKNRVNVEDDKFEYGRHGVDQHNSKVLLYEFQVRLKGNKYKTIIVSPSVKTTEIDCFIRPYVTNGFNMKIGNLHKYGKLYPISFAQMNKKMQDELNGYTRHLMDIADRNIPKYVTDKNKVKTDAKEALRNTLVNDIVEVDGNTAGAVTPLQPTQTSYENKELLSIFQDQKNKLWSVSESRISGNAEPEFAEQLKIQEKGNLSRNVDIQEGLRFLIQEEMETFKDLIVTFWDGEIFLKLTGEGKPGWYEPQIAPDPNNPQKNMVLNPLTDLLPDYDVKIDIASSGRPNKEQRLSKQVMFMEKLVEMRQVLIDQGKDINIDEIKRISKDFGWDPDKIFVEHQPAMIPTVPTAGGETISPEEDARRQQEAEARFNGGS